jgi:hypothetical protein
VVGHDVTTGGALTDEEAGVAGPAPAAEGRAQARWWRGMPASGGVYLLGSLILWWNVWWENIWSSHSTVSTIATSNDTSAFIWFLEWPAYALTHGRSLTYTTALFHPTGFNLLTNTGVLAISVPLMPVTWIFGPVASFNVALTLAPVASALGMFVLLRRWVTWLPAAFIGGVLYGFCPFILQSLTEGQLHQGFLMFPPLIVLCLDEILFRQQARAWAIGLLLGLLVTAQFFVGTEILVMLALVIAFCIVIVAAYWVLRTDRSMVQLRYAAIGLFVGGVVSVVLLAYPAWYALAGPAHLSGRIWPLDLPHMGNSLSGFVNPARVATSPFSGAGFTRQYLGIGLVVVCVIGLCIWRRDKKLQLAGAGAVISLVLSLGAGRRVPLPWRYFGDLPVLLNIFPRRFIIIAYLALGVMLGLIVDHVHRAVASRPASEHPVGGPHAADTSRTSSPLPRAAAAAVAVGVVALLPLAAYVAPDVPVPAHAVVFPSWFRNVGPNLPGHQVVLVLPMPYFLENSLTWQAMDHMRYDLVSGVGPEGDRSRGGRNAPAQEFLDGLASPAIAPPVVTPDAIATVRGAVDRWGVTTIVIPTDGNAPAWQWRVNSVPFSVAFMTLVTGSRPVLQEHAWVWYGVEHSGPPATISTSAFDACTSTVPTGTDSVADVTRVVDCVRASSDGSRNP